MPRQSRSLPLYLFLKHLGVEQIGLMVERRQEMTVKLIEKIKADSDMVLISPENAITLVHFVYIPEDMRAIFETDEEKAFGILNSLTGSIAKSLLESGDVWLHCATVPDSKNNLQLKDDNISKSTKVLRFMSGNPNLEEQHLEKMIQLIKEHGIEISRFLKNY